MRLLFILTAKTATPTFEASTTKPPNNVYREHDLLFLSKNVLVSINKYAFERELGPKIPAF
jgi:hypothetical protein